MTDTRPSDPAIAESGESSQGSARRNRGVTPGEFVRDKILELARNPDSVANAPIRADLVPLIERTFRYTYMLATKMRDDMIESGHRKELDELINEARELQDSLWGSATTKAPQSRFLRVRIDGEDSRGTPRRPRCSLRPEPGPGHRARHSPRRFRSDPASLAPPIGRLFRYAYVLATATPDEIITSGDAREIHQMVTTDRRPQHSLTRGHRE